MLIATVTKDRIACRKTHTSTSVLPDSAFQCLLLLTVGQSVDRAVQYGSVTSLENAVLILAGGSFHNLLQRLPPAVPQRHLEDGPV